MRLPIGIGVALVIVILGVLALYPSGWLRMDKEPAQGCGGSRSPRPRRDNGHRRAGPRGGGPAGCSGRGSSVTPPAPAPPRPVSYSPSPQPPQRERSRRFALRDLL